MTLARTALRLLTVAALSGDEAARPTIAQARVYDSRISDLSPESFSEDAKPIVIVLTDKDEGEATGDQNGGPPFRRNIELMFEIGMVARIQDGDSYVVDYPDTDDRLEASLDLLEFQVIRRLAHDPAALSSHWRRLARVWKYDGHRQVLDESGVKLACRVLTLTCETPDDDVPLYNAAGVIPTGLDVLPEPLLGVAKLLPAGSSGKLICDQLAAALAPPLTVPAFEGLDATYDAANTTPEEGDDREVKAVIDVEQVDPPPP